MPIYALDDLVPHLPADCRYWIAPDANIIGKVRLEEDASVWFGCTLRGDREWIVVGARSNVQEGTVIHTDPGFPLHIGADCTVGHGCILHGCTIGEGSLIGMGATILNGAKIGRNCLVGANALVTEGKEFPDGSLIIGAPAKAVRVMDAAEIEKMRRGAAHYVANARAYASGLRRLDP
jgi:carbonic anhydrase/acetyltransferase-like protein (isoleucine patch superfamily)